MDGGSTNAGNEEHPENPRNIPDQHPGRPEIPRVAGAITTNGEETRMKEESEQVSRLVWLEHTIFC